MAEGQADHQLLEQPLHSCLRRWCTLQQLASRHEEAGGCNESTSNSRPLQLQHT